MSTAESSSWTLPHANRLNWMLELNSTTKNIDKSSCSNIRINNNNFFWICSVHEGERFCFCRFGLSKSQTCNRLTKGGGKTWSLRKNSSGVFTLKRGSCCQPPVEKQDMKSPVLERRCCYLLLCKLGQAISGDTWQHTTHSLSLRNMKFITPNFICPRLLEHTQHIHEVQMTRVLGKIN